MSYGVELLDDDGNVVAGPKDLLALAAPFLGGLPGQAEAGVQCLVLLLPVPDDDNDLPGDPYLTYRSPEIGFVQVRIATRERIIYRHPHTIGEILGEGLRQWTARLDDPSLANPSLADHALADPSLADPGPVTGYRLTGPGLENLVGRDTPSIEGLIELEPFAEGERPAFRIRPLPPPAPPLASLASLGAKPLDDEWQEPEGADFVKVLVDEPVHAELSRTRHFSEEVEEGGFLVGNVYEDEDRPGTYITQVTAALQARKTGASLLHFTFTGDSFDHVKQVLERERPGEKILGWYHTHLFPATDEVGLSTIDFRLHFTTFRIPWQLAGLVNIDGDERVLRFYVRRDDTMALCPHQAVARLSGERSP